MFTRMQYVELARGIRCLMAQDRADIERLKGHSVTAIFEKSLESHRELLEKVEELAKAAD